MSDETKFGIILSLDDDDFTSDLKFAAGYTKAVAKQMKEDTTIKLDYDYETFSSSLVVIKSRLAEIKDEMSSTEDPAELKLLNKEAEDLNDTLKFMTENYRRYLAAGEKATKVIDVNLKTSIKQVSKLALGLVGIRGIWSVLYRASHAYMNDNKIINEQLKITFSILSQAIGPVIKTLVNIVEYGAIVIARIIQAFTRVNILEKAQTSALKDLAKAAKKAHSALASFDTISNLSDNSDALEDYNAALGAYNDFVSKMGEVENFWDKWGSWVTAAAGALGILWGTKTLGGIAKLIGVAGTGLTAGTGLAGVVGLLSGIATFAGLTITIWLIIKGWERLQELKAFMEKWTPEYIEERTNSLKNTADTIDYIKESTDDIKDNAAKMGENYNFFNDMVEGIFGNHKKVLKTAEDIVKATAEINGKVEGIIKNQNISKDEAQKLLDYLVEQYRVNGDIETQLFNQGKDTKDIEGIQKDLLEKIITIRDQYKVSNDYIWSIYDGTKEINGIHLTDKYVKVNIEADTKSAERTTDGWFTSLKKKVSSFFNKLYVAGFSAILPQFDVGTNYVPQDTVAMVHKGEMIVPAKYNPMTSGLGGTNEETNALLRQLNATLENKQFNGYISASDITNTAINGINQQSRIMGKSVIK